MLYSDQLLVSVPQRTYFLGLCSICLVSISGVDCVLVLAHWAQKERERERERKREAERERERERERKTERQKERKKDRMNE